jgi:hypothetical protein
MAKTPPEKTYQNSQELVWHETGRLSIAIKDI